MVLGLMNTEPEEIQKAEPAGILSKSLKYGNYNPANSSINESISSGKLKLVRNPALKKNLFKWLQLLKDADVDFKNQDTQATTLLIPYLYKHISVQNLNTYNNMEVDNNSELFSGDYYEVFHDLEFENLYQGKLLWNTEMLNHYKKRFYHEFNGIPTFGQKHVYRGTFHQVASIRRWMVCRIGRN